MCCLVGGGSGVFPAVTMCTSGTTSERVVLWRASLKWFHMKSAEQPQEEKEEKKRKHKVYVRGDTQKVSRFSFPQRKVNTHTHTHTQVVNLLLLCLISP